MSFYARPGSSNSAAGSFTGPTGNDRNYAYRELEQTPRSSLGSKPLSVMYTRDWRTALRTPPTYRIGNRTVRFNYHFALLLTGVLGLFILFFYIKTGSQSSSDTAWVKTYISENKALSVATPTRNSGSSSIINKTIGVSNKENGDSNSYNKTYPLTLPLIGKGGQITFRIGMVADLDTDSKVVKSDGSTVWRSYLKKGYLNYIASKKSVKVSWDSGEPVSLESAFSLKGRGMELSELVTFDGKLLTFDDRTGMIYEIHQDKVLPWIILLDGDGHNAKGFKSEWATVKQQYLFVGSMGKEWTTGSGDFENENPMFVKVVKTTGEVTSLNWAYNFKILRQKAMQISWPGYMIHESGVWSEVHKKWFFLPRRCSNEKYNESRDEHMGCNLMITANELFDKIETIPLDAKNTSPTHGFSSFKFVPGSDDSIILAIKSEELNGKTSTFITAFDVAGKTLMPEEKIDTEFKYEGLEFI